MSKIIKCSNCGQKNKINDRVTGQIKCGKCGMPLELNTNLLSNPIILIFFPAIWILLQTKVYYYMGFSEASGGALAIFGISLIIPLIVFAVKKFKQRPYTNFVKHTFIGTVIVFALALVSFMDSHNWKFPSPAQITYRQGNYKLTFELVEEGCYAGNPTDCSKLASLYMDGKGVEKNLNSATTFFEKACKGGHPRACWSLGAYYTTGGLGQKDTDISFKYYREACESVDKGHESNYIGKGCSQVADMYQSGTGTYQSDLMAREYAQKAKDILKRSCDNNNADSCSSLADIYYFGKGVKVDHFKSKELYSKACKKNNPIACVLLGMQYEEGEGVKKDYGKALKYYGKACDDNFAWGCEKYSKLK